MLLIVGLDGATWRLMEPWMAEGRLPHLAALRAAGCWGPLQSTVPPATFPSWTTFMTGVNPGKHGIFDFTRREPREYSLRFVNGTYRKVPTVWRILSDHGRRVCVLGLPGTYPPESVNGCMVSGFDTPVTTRADAGFVFPPDLAGFVAQFGGFPFADFQEFRVGRRWHERALGALLRAIEGKTRLAEALLGRESWDVFLLLFGESDTVAHHFWKFHDRDSPQFDGGRAARFGDAIRKVYEALDAAVGRLCGRAPGATVLVASDHGFGGVGKKTVHLNHWLHSRGWLRRLPVRPLSQLTGWARHAALTRVPASLQARAFRLGGGRFAAAMESRARFGGIDWAGTIAFSEELNYFPSVWVNVRGREPHGIVEPGDYERVCDELRAAAMELRDPEHGRPVVRRALHRDELYSGPWVQFAPDVVLELALDQGYSYACQPARTGTLPGSVSIRDDAWRRDGKLAGLSGSHRPDGVFLLSGPGTSRRGPAEGVRMEDMAPTVLRLCGVRPPAYFDGESLVGEAGGGRPDGAFGEPVALPEQAYGPADEQLIAARLRALGYLP